MLHDLMIEPLLKHEIRRTAWRFPELDLVSFQRERVLYDPEETMRRMERHGLRAAEPEYRLVSQGGWVPKPWYPESRSFGLTLVDGEYPLGRGDRTLKKARWYCGIEFLVRDRSLHILQVKGRRAERGCRVSRTLGGSGWRDFLLEAVEDWANDGGIAESRILHPRFSQWYRNPSSAEAEKENVRSRWLRNIRGLAERNGYARDGVGWSKRLPQEMSQRNPLARLRGYLRLRKEERSGPRPYIDAFPCL